MGVEPGQALAALGDATLRTWGVALALTVAIVALPGRRRLPPGSGEAVFVAAVSAAVLLLLAVDSSGNLVEPALGHVLTALTVLWYVLSRVAARQPSPRRTDGEAEGRYEAAGAGSAVLVYGALACGLTALIGSGSSLAARSLLGSPAATADFAVLSLLAVLIRLYHAGRWATYPAVILLVSLVVAGVPSEVLARQANACGVGMNVAAALSLLAVVGANLLQWWRRRRAWMADPGGLTEFEPPSKAILVSLVGVGWLVGVAGVVFRDATFTPTAVVLAAVTCLTIGHLRTWLGASEIGLVLLAESIVTASSSWLWPGGPGRLLGLAIAGLYLLWLARFWNQQLDDTIAWTTTGRLIPSARRLAYSAAAGVPAFTLVEFRSGALPAQTVWATVATALLLLGFASFLIRDGYRRAALVAPRGTSIMPS